MLLSELRSREFVLVEDRLNRRAGGYVYVDPKVTITCYGRDDVASALRRIDAGLQEGLHAAGYIAYELAYALEPRLRRFLTARVAASPLFAFGLFESPAWVSCEELDRHFGSLKPAPPISNVCPAHDEDTHRDKVRRVLELIQAGDIYQANLTFAINFLYGGDPLSLYSALRSAQPVAHGGVIALAEQLILSVSPELFIEVRGTAIKTRPMKGTVPRGKTQEGDYAARTELLLDPKQRAENLMIVDLLRNDLGRVSVPGSVSVTDLFELETYPTFHTLTSTVQSRLRGGVGLQERLASLFPCGSIVGAPKIRAAEILAELEHEPRGAYSGGIGVITPSLDMKFNVAIRTAIMDENGKGRFNVGGGIVADSDPKAEYEEARLKGKVLEYLAEDYYLIETLKWDAQLGLIRVEEHMNRLLTSARELDFEVPLRSTVFERLRRLLSGMRRASAHVRIILYRTGQLLVEQDGITALARHPRLVVSNVRLDSANPLYRHKTSRREVYDSALTDAAGSGYDEAVLLNQDGLVADCCRSNILIRLGDQVVTPPVEDGSLPGVLRGVLLARGIIKERSVSRQQMAEASDIFLCSSLRGIRRAGSIFQG